jgi:hypothetical protein
MESEIVESDMVADILQAAYQERQRLESLLRSNADFQKLEEVRRIIDLYEQPDEQPPQNPAPADPIVHPTPLGSTFRAARSPDRISRRRWRWGYSPTSQISAEAAHYLRITGERATSGEIYKAIASKGVEVGGKKPGSVVSARLSASEIFDRTPEGYGLREWLDGGAPRKVEESVQIPTKSPADSETISPGDTR